MIVKLHKPIFLFLICAVLTLTKTAPASDCSPNSAWLTYAADDYLTFYVNGNPVINSARDPGAVNTTIGIPIVYFNAAGVANYFAAKVTNDQANIVGGLWLITIKCADGSYSYISNEDATYQMYDDLSGGSPPPGPGNWYDPGYTDPANKFTGAPVLATPAFWFAPVTNPITGNPLMMLSHNAGGTQSSVSEVLYFREQVIIPTPMPTLTPTISPTPYPVGCGTPVLQGMPQTIWQGCPGSQPGFTANVTIPAINNPLLIIRMEKGNGGLPAGLPTVISYDGVPMNLLQADATYAAGGFLATYYLAGPHPGTHPLVVSFAANYPCNWNVEAEIYTGVDQLNPIGAVVVPTGVSTPGVVVNITTTGPASLVSSFFASDQGAITSTGPGQVSFTSGWSIACCEKVEGDYKIVGGPGLQTLNYTDTQAGRKYTGQTIEIRGAAACGTLTFTPTNTPPPTDTYTFTPTATYTPTRTITPSPTYTNTFSPTAIIFTLTNTPTPSGTPTYTATRTTTPTASITYTYTNTPTPSATLTPSPTPSVTYTATPTPTYTATPTASPTASITYTMTITPTFSGTPTDTPSATLTNTPTLSPTFTFTRTITDTYTWTPTFSITSTFSPSPTITETPVPMPIGIHIVIYNSGGEVVRHLFQGFSPLALNHPALSVPAFVLGRGKVEVKVGDGNSSAVLTTWDGTGDLGQPVAAGEYYVKIESNDNYSRTTSVILSVGVFPKQTQNWLRVFTSSGEMVADLSFMLKLAPDVNLEEMSLESTTFAEAYDPATGNALAPLYIHLRDNKGGTQTVPWNGYNQAGRPVDTGWYYLQACSNKDTGQVLINRQVEVIKAKGEDLGAEVYAAPNPAGMAALGSVQTQVSVYYKPVALWGVARVKLYDLSGQVVGGGQDGQGTGRVDVEISSLASGVYLADFEYQDSAGQVRRKVLKLAIVK